MMKVHAEPRGGRKGNGPANNNDAYTRKAAQQMRRQTGATVAQSRLAVQSNIRGTTGAGSGRPMRRGNFI